jgi:hypothetical protein
LTSCKTAKLLFLNGKKVKCWRFHTAGVAGSNPASPTTLEITERYQTLRLFSGFTFEEFSVCFPRKHFFRLSKAETSYFIHGVKVD